MSFTNVWDDTQPPDTQLANQLGLDIRNLKLDIAQRMSAFGAGMLGAQQTPESVFGSPSQGVLYYAYDTGQIFQWTGSVWTVVAISKVLSDTTSHNQTNPSSGTVFSQVQIPANVLQAGTVVDIVASVSAVGSSVSNPMNLMFGTSSVISWSQEFNWQAMLQATVVVTGSSSQNAIGFAQANGNNSPFILSSNPGASVTSIVPVTIQAGANNTGQFFSNLLVVRIRF